MYFTTYNFTLSKLEQRKETFIQSLKAIIIKAASMSNTWATHTCQLSALILENVSEQIEWYLKY